MKWLWVVGTVLLYLLLDWAWVRYKNRRAIRQIVDPIFEKMFDPAGGKMQVGVVEALDVRVAVATQVVELNFSICDDPPELFEADIVLEIVSPAELLAEVEFRVLEFRLSKEGVIGGEAVFSAGKVPYPPIGLLCSIPVTGMKGIFGGGRGWGIAMSYMGDESILRTTRDIVLQFQGPGDAKSHLMFYGHLGGIRISEPKSATVPVAS